MRSRTPTKDAVTASLDSTPLEPSLTEEEAARIVGVAVKTMRNWRSKGIGPPWIAVGRKLVRYRPADLRAYQEANLRRWTGTARTNDSLSKGIAKDSRRGG